MTRGWTKEFHIHVDASWVEPRFERLLGSQLGFYTMEFERTLQNGVSYAPERHLTKKYSDARQFVAESRFVLDTVKAAPSIEGYVETECVGPEIEIEAKPFDARVRPPFELDLKWLSDGEFREAEVHITMSNDSSDQRLVDCIKGMGLYSAFMKKRTGMAQILTIQGSRDDISQVGEALLGYLREAGGAVNCQFKEERISRYWLSRPDVIRPPVIDKIWWRRGEGFKFSDR